MPPRTETQIIENRRALLVEWPDGEHHRYHGIWLRDNGQDSESRDPSSGQKKFSVTDLELGAEISSSHVGGNRLEIVFSDGTKTWIDLQWLKSNHYDQHAEGALIEHDKVVWDSDFDPAKVSADFSEVNQSAEGLATWLRWISTFGFARLTGVPSQAGALFDVIGLFGFVRETNYGRLFEVRSTAKPVNLAFTREGLDPHTDNPYRDPVPTLQILHCIENDSEGGESVVVDGFRSVEILRQESPQHFDLLSRYNASFEYQGDGKSCLRASKPHIELSPEGELLAVRVNNRSSGALTAIPYDKVPDFYAACAHLTEITCRAALAVQFKLEPGELFIVDNTRVLHGRKEYSETGSRWFQGAYADKDSLLSTLRLIESRNT
ncbi:MAG: 2-trimethylaminoethylphosphonate dioxygenase [bacterium]